MRPAGRSNVGHANACRAQSIRLRQVDSVRAAAIATVTRTVLWAFRASGLGTPSRNLPLLLPSAAFAAVCAACDRPAGHAPPWQNIFD
ncbi:hypothetical protein BASA81_010598 [Batrachochytrium salamandrivorans]|nr:hypothetical protein BASA81_010598 [Batrachochytrium salamandrivorans]